MITPLLDDFCIHQIRYMSFPQQELSDCIQPFQGKNNTDRQMIETYIYDTISKDIT